MNIEKPCSVVILISGSGSNLQALLEKSKQPGSAFHISAVISNKAEALGLQRAERSGVSTHVIRHTDFDSRESFDQSLMQLIDSYEPNLVVLAGFMRILTQDFTEHYHGRMMNIHPSLLPKHKGLNTHQRAIDAGDTEHGCSVHFVTNELDGGPIIVQASTTISTDDDANSLAYKVLKLEHQIYPLAVQWYAAGRLRLQQQGVVLDGNTLPPSGYPFSPDM